MMTMHEFPEIILSIAEGMQKIEVRLQFDKQPTKEQLVEATRHYLTDQHKYYTNRSALLFMEAVKTIDEVPKMRCFKKLIKVGTDSVYIWCVPMLIFKVHSVE